MTVLVHFDGKIGVDYQQRLAALLPEMPVKLWPEMGDPAAIRYLVMWGTEPGLIGSLPHLKGILSPAAGVNHILNAPDRPPQVPIVRLLDSGMGPQIAEYALHAVLDYQRHFALYRDQQAVQTWKPRRYQAPGEVTVGILGLGTLGAVLAQRLIANGYRVIGWRSSDTPVPGVEVFAGKPALTDFLKQTQVLICLLPFTEKTAGILNRDLFALLPNDAMVVNLGRGGLLREADLLHNLDNGPLSRAILDVFEAEPLPPDHPFWVHPKITVTPHVAAATPRDQASVQMADAIRVLERGGTPEGQVDPARGY
ncbi:MAG: 2-hydroxyacid dehydrogenase [Magnetospiraceae bacterium]